MLCKFAGKDESNTAKMSEICEVKRMGGRTYEVWISRDEMVDFLLYAASLDASVATRSKISLTKEFRMDMARLEIPVSG